MLDAQDRRHVFDNGIQKNLRLFQLPFGAATLDGAGELETGAAVRCTDAGARGLVATVDDTEVVIWEMASELAT